MPDPDVTEFVLTQLRPKGRAARTVSAYLRAIGHGLSHFQRAGVILEERVAAGTYLSTPELTAFATACKRGQRKLSIDKDEASGRYSRFVEYLCWRAELVIGRTSSEASFERARLALKRFKTRVGAVAPPPDASIQSPDARGGLAKKQRENLLAVIRPDDERNPWDDPALKARNFAMVQLAYELGPRAGDVLSLKIRDTNLTRRPASVTFHRRHDDPEDPRKDQPVLKTKPRVLEISDELALALELWIDRNRANRARFPEARKHPFVFTNNRGEPLGQRGYQLVFKKLRTKFPELGKLVSHVLRHDWNDRWQDLRAESTDHSANWQREQCYAMGWADRSTMPARYASRAIAASANKKIARMNSAAQARGEKSAQERERK
ncbi:MAG: site-specific integrase [Xanthomonadales bacterium]|nr:site-specific integrase [Xanthomonadales bacterium]